MSSNIRERKPGRPRIISKELEPEVISICKQGFGYRATARELGKKGISVNWSTVRRLIKENLDENLIYKVEYCYNLVGVKPQKTIHSDLDYCLGVAKAERHKNL